MVVVARQEVRSENAHSYCTTHRQVVVVSLFSLRSFQVENYHNYFKLVIEVFYQIYKSHVDMQS